VAQVVETTIANNVTGMGEISKLINKVGELDQEQKRLAAAMLQVKGAGDKLTKSTNNVASATRAQASAANELRNRLDPMFAAQKRFNQQMDEADRLYEAGVI
jgi:predicted  nucleic acid-binding Zn-ribbon protein